MEELVDMIIGDESPSDISDKIKEILFTKGAERIDGLKPAVASTVFNQDIEYEPEEDSEEDQE